MSFSMYNNANRLLASSILFASICFLGAALAEENPSAEESPVVTVQVEASFQDMTDAVKSSIEGKGLHIAHILHASDMLNRTGKSFGFDKALYQDAQIIEFCSARISHELSRASPENIVLCPFTIGVYVLADDPKHVRLTYRRPFVMGPGSEDSTRAMEELVGSVVEEASSW